ncbi:MAG: hypothetical protein IKR94_03555 [Bacteroidales bacterium]|nr:hypothetical protein [Bacteroidales bacterium]
MITIGNPIFDSVFKFFLADDTAARILLSALIKKKVTKLETRKNEFMQKGDNGEISVMRIDFGAHIVTQDANGNDVDQLIIIELQKAWVNYEVPRFRRYLGQNYIASENIFHDAKDDRDYGLPIIAVYILNHRVGNLTEPVTYLNRKYLDYDGNELTTGVPDKFGESLSHDCIIVQVPLLSDKIRNRAEKILQVFNQKFSVAKKGFKMQFDDTLTEGDSDMQKIVNRLSMVFTDDYTTELMIVENEEYQLHAEHLAAKEELAEQKEKIAEQNAILIAKEQELAQQKKQLDEKDKQLDEKDKQLNEKDKQLAETDALLSASIKMLASAGIPHEQIAQKLNISMEKVEALMAS